MSTDNEPQPCARCGEMTYLARDYDGCCDALCAEILDGLRKDDLIEELEKQLKDLWAQFRNLQEKWQYVSNQNLDYMVEVGELQAKLAEAERSADYWREDARYTKREWVSADAKLAEAEARSSELRKRVEELERKLDEALSLIDGVTEVVELHKCHSPSQSAWKEHWLRRANSILRDENE